MIVLNLVKVLKCLLVILGVDQVCYIFDEVVVQVCYDEFFYGVCDVVIFEVFYGGGLCVGELCGFDLGDVD